MPLPGQTRAKGSRLAARKVGSCFDPLKFYQDDYFGKQQFTPSTARHTDDRSGSCRVAGLDQRHLCGLGDERTNDLVGNTHRRQGANQFLAAFDHAEVADLATSAVAPPSTNAPAPPANRRGNPPPFDSPPFPGAEWQIGGTETIGDLNLTTDFPLMEALYAGPHGQWWSDSRIKFYGWEIFPATSALPTPKV